LKYADRHYVATNWGDGGLHLGERKKGCPWQRKRKNPHLGAGLTRQSGGDGSRKLKPEPGQKKRWEGIGKNGLSIRGLKERAAEIENHSVEKREVPINGKSGRVQTWKPGGTKGEKMSHGFVAKAMRGDLKQTKKKRNHGLGSLPWKSSGWFFSGGVTRRKNLLAAGKGDLSKRG